jgi:hypothetical protein
VNGDGKGKKSEPVFAKGTVNGDVIIEGKRMQKCASMKDNSRKFLAVHVIHSNKWMFNQRSTCSKEMSRIVSSTIFKVKAAMRSTLVTLKQSVMQFYILNLNPESFCIYGSLELVA